MLDERDKALFARLGVFVGGWTLDSVETVCASEADVYAFEAVSSLIDKSLVRQEGFAGDEPRFSMLETVREYALERLREREEVDLRRDLHASWGSDSNQAMIEEFVAAIREHRSPRVTGWDGYRAVEVVAAAYESARRGQPVRIAARAETT